LRVVMLICLVTLCCSRRTIRLVANYVRQQVSTGCSSDESMRRVVARGNKEEMRARLATIVERLGASDPDRTAFQITLLINGAYASGLMAEPADLRGDLVDAAMKLLA
ncbi:hypothetical protein RA280_47990, partial [Cupriavidus sp. CV2]|nr:hypothetical protein [Cupriavidus sp. CV2]